MSDDETRNLERRASAGDAEAARAALDVAVRTRNGWIVVWRAGPMEPPSTPGERPVSFVVGREAGTRPERWPAWAAWVGTIQDLWSVLGSLRGKRAYVVELATGAAYPVGGTPVALVVGQREGDADPEGGDLPDQVRKDLGEPRPPTEAERIFGMVAQILPRALSNTPGINEAVQAGAAAGAVAAVNENEAGRPGRRRRRGPAGEAPLASVGQAMLSVELPEELRQAVESLGEATLRAARADANPDGAQRRARRRRGGGSR